MGKTSNGGLGYGIGSGSQTSLEQENVNSKIDELTKQVTNAKISDEYTIEDLRKAGLKFNPDDVIFVTKDKSDQLIWLENGGKNAGLTHILYGDGINSFGHASDFKNAFGINPNQVGDYLKQVITYGKVVSNREKTVVNGKGYEKVYYY